MQTIAKGVNELTLEEYRQCYSLNMRERGVMRDELVALRQSYNKTAKVILIKETGRILGWCLLQENEYHGGYTVNFYVRRDYRKQGLGSLLMKECMKYDPEPFVEPHDKRSGKFFGKFSDTIRCEPKYRNRWVKKVDR